MKRIIKSTGRTFRQAGLGGCMTFSVLLLAVLGCTGPRISDADLRTLDYERFVELREADEDVLVAVVDVRQPAAYQAGHIPGAINMPLDQLRRRDPRLANATRIIVYAGGSSSSLSPAAAKTLMTMNYDNVFDFRGGLQAWREAGGEVE